METILFLIIAGILSTIFGKSKGKNHPGRSKPFTAKGLGDFRTTVDQQMGSFPRKTGQISTGQPVERKLRDIEEKYQPMKTSTQRLSAEQMKSIASTKMEMEPMDSPLERPEEKTIISGIIWAEILGEPRAKKPYFPRKR
jgi:hypothetical protein